MIIVRASINNTSNNGSIGQILLDLTERQMENRFLNTILLFGMNSDFIAIHYDGRLAWKDLLSAYPGVLMTTQDSLDE
jgi:hypothetical protein